MKDFFILKGGGVELTGAPETIIVLPLGHVVSSKGEFDVDEGSFQAMKAQIVQRGVDLVVDYEHQTLKGIEAPAAGWVGEGAEAGGREHRGRRGVDAPGSGVSEKQGVPLPLPRGQCPQDGQ